MAGKGVGGGEKQAWGRGENKTSPPHCQNLSDTSGPGCSKLTTSLVNVSLKFQTLIS